MSEVAKKLTPEEKLLALIQQDKRHSNDASQQPSSPSPAPIVSAPVVGKPEPPPVPAPVVPPPTPVPQAQAKETAQRLKLADPPVPAVVPVVKPEAGPVAVSPAAVKPEPVLAVPEPVEQDETVDSPAVAVEVAASASSYVGLAPARGTGLVLVNRALGVVVVLLIALVFYRIGAIRPGIAEAIEHQVVGAGSLSVQPLVVPQGGAPAVDTYLDKVAARNAFIAKTLSKGEGGTTRVEQTGAPKDYKLVAVSIDSSSASDSMAIIRNKTDSKTYFVKLGQTVGSSDYVLDQVYGDHVVVKLQKQLFDLK